MTSHFLRLSDVPFLKRNNACVCSVHAIKGKEDDHEEIASVVSFGVDGLCFDFGACYRVRDRLRAGGPGMVWAAGSKLGSFNFGEGVEQPAWIGGPHRSIRSAQSASRRSPQLRHGIARELRKHVAAFLEREIAELEQLS